MTTANGKEALKCSTGTLMMIYYVIAGLAITEALQNTFLKDGRFMGARAFSSENLPRTLLLFALLPTICRFVHGASMHLGVPSDKRYKPLVDFFGFFLQASIFYMMASSLGTPTLFSLFFGALLLFDTVWLIVLRLIRYLEFDSTPTQWLVSNIVIIGCLYGIYLCRTRVPDVAGASLILVVTFVATVADYAMNRDFYFPAQDHVVS